MVKFTFSVLATFMLILSLSSPASAGNRYYQNESGFFIFDLFANAPDSKYRKGRPKVYGYRKKVGGYSYKYSDTLNGYGSKPSDFSPIFDRGLFSTRLGTDGPYLGY